MKYTVVSTDAADQQLAEIWHSAVDKSSVTDAADRIDRDLRNDPERKTNAARGFCFYQVSPLVVALEIVPEDRIVRILQVKRITE